MYGKYFVWRLIGCECICKSLDKLKFVFFNFGLVYEGHQVHRIDWFQKSYAFQLSKGKVERVTTKLLLQRLLTKETYTGDQKILQR